MVSPPADLAAATVPCWRRPDGRAGVRNHVVALPVDDISNAACEMVARTIHGVTALPHAYGRLQFGADLDLHFRTMIGTGANPNVAAAVVIGLEPEWTRTVADGIAATGKPVAAFSIEQHGDLETIMRASRAAKDFLHWASELQREPCPLGDLWISTKCGESDTTTGLSASPAVGAMFDRLLPLGVHACFGETTELTGAEHLCEARAATPEAADKFMRRFIAYHEEVIEPNRTGDLSDSQPTKGNILGGITTIEEKALGSLRKLGRTARYIDALGPAEAPGRGPGMYFMDTSSAGAECVTLMAAAGFTLHAFPTGQGNVLGHPVVPVVKITGNPRTARTMGEHIDLDVSAMLRLEMTEEEAGEALVDLMLRTARGRITAAEALGHREFSMTRLHRSA